MKKEIANLLDSVGSAYKVNSESYPVLNNLTKADDILNFSLSHSLKHMLKRVGRLARNEVVPKDSKNDLWKALYNILISGFKMAEILGIKEDEISKGLILNTKQNYNLTIMQLLVDMGYLADLLKNVDQGASFTKPELEKAQVFVINCIDDVCTLALSQGIETEVFLSQAHLYI
ncbi:MAG TPA: hypothetical protein PLQ20_01770 [Candidatus Paceibacterota bacterium]|nr:hypothetical protein [Candidatus Paceibacterota bacterium]